MAGSRARKTAATAKFDDDAVLPDEFVGHVSFGLYPIIIGGRMMDGGRLGRVLRLKAAHDMLVRSKGRAFERT